MPARPKQHEPPTADPGRDDLRAEFDRLADEWETQTSTWSIVERRFEHPAYQAILKMGRTHGRSMVDLIEERRRSRHGLWGYVLDEIKRAGASR